MTAHRTALYYPYISINNVGLLKNALLLWDKVELICPFDALPSTLQDPELQSAFDLLARPLQPTEVDKRRVHNAVLELAESSLPKWFFPEFAPDNSRFAVYPEKFLPETWEALQATKLARPRQVYVDPPASPRAMHEMQAQANQEAYETTRAFGFTMMSILADCCAGGTRQLVTDESAFYLALDSYLKTIGGAKLMKRRKSRHERLVTLSLLSVDVSHVGLQSLIALRKQEDARPELRLMRHNYANRLAECSERLRTVARNRRDVLEIERIFKQEIADDIALLREELRDEAKKVIFSKEIAAAAIALPFVFVEPASSLIAFGALYRSKVNYGAAINKTLGQHSMSWLYQYEQFARPKRFRFF